jgi:DNA polymerase delta subunit 2
VIKILNKRYSSTALEHIAYNHHAIVIVKDPHTCRLFSLQYSTIHIQMTITTTTTRAYAEHKPHWQKFQTARIQPTQKVAAAANQSTAPHPYLRQYSHVYHQRLQFLKPRFPNKTVNRILDLSEGVHTIVVGTLVKEQGSGDDNVLVEGTLCRATDTLFLEDESGRVQLANVLPQLYPTGVVVAVEGTVGRDGMVTVQCIHNPSPPSDYPMDTSATTAFTTNSKRPAENDNTKKPFLLLLSGINCGDPSVSSLPRELLLMYLQGVFGTSQAANVSHIIIAGGLMSTPDALSEFDNFCAQLAACAIPVDILPGKDDPTTAVWPQRPLHRSLLPKARNTEIVSCTPNPYAASFNNKYVLGTDGTNIFDLQQHACSSDTTRLSELAALVQTLELSHVCPTGPSSVPTAPHATSDPMVIRERPQLYFHGNASAFATCMSDSTRCVCVPKFSETGQAVLVDLETMDVELLKFEMESTQL